MTNIILKAVTIKLDIILNLPGSKSIANRVLLLAAVACGENIIHNVPVVSEDVMLMLEALIKLGVCIKKLDEVDGCASYKIIGCNGSFPVKQAEIFCGNSGTTIRFLTAMLSVMDGAYILTGIARMKERPIVDLINALKQIGANIGYVENSGYPPIKIQPFRYNNNELIKISGKTSSQYLTGVLMAMPLVKNNIIIEIIDELISKPYIDITLGLLEIFGCEIKARENNYIIENDVDIYAVNYTIEPDASSASYFLAMGALRGQVAINNLSHSSLQGDKNFASTLSLMGAVVDYSDVQIRVTSAQLHGITVNMEDMPDVAMTLAVVALFATGKTTIMGIQSWKVKETDRLQAMYNELTKLGARVSRTDSSITIEPPQKILENIAIDTYNDHRMAMCFSLIAVGGVPVIINNYQCVGKTFANYFDIFNQLMYSI